MRRSINAVAMAVIGIALSGIVCEAQTVAPLKDTPLQAIPYEPSLDPASMDKTADPCVDFYQYSCGGWMKNNPIPTDRARWDVYSKLDQDNERVLWGISLADADATDRTPVQQKVGDYFAACIDVAAVNAAGMKPIEKDMAAIEAIAKKDEITGYVAKAHLDGQGNVLFRAGSMPDYGDADKVILGLDAGGLGLPDRDYYTKTDAKSVAIRAKYEAFVAQMLEMSGEAETKAKADAKAVMAFETRLAQASLTRVEKREPHNLYHMMTLAEVEKTAPQIRWSEFFAVQGVTPAGQMNVSEPKFFAAMGQAVEETPLETLKTYLRFHRVRSAAPYLAENFQVAYFDFYSKTLRGIPQMPPRWKKCVREEDRFMGEALGQEFVRREFSPEAKAATVKMTQQIEEAMGQEIEHLDWMSDATKQQALKKLHAIRNKIGYPDKWRDYSTLTIERGDYFGNVQRAQEFEVKREWAKVGKPLDRTEWDMSPPTVNADYDPQRNDINFPAGVLQPPLYDPKMDDAPNYGNTGGTIGHELTHGFDDEGRQFDAQGNLKDWWTAEDAKKFEERVQCVRDQYAQYVVVDDIHINSKLTSGEDVADQGGELLAYIAWKAQTATMDLQTKEGLTPDQRFFVGFAQWACENDRPEDARSNAMLDPHSPGRYRINGVVVNMPEFSKAFGCKAGQPMVKANACRVW
jgi:endothelin-converting enzyme/putative endopeptidase